MLELERLLVISIIASFVITFCSIYLPIVEYAFNTISMYL